MTIRRCHSPFKHYELFHNNIAYSTPKVTSIFNIYNVGSGHCHGGFWSGFGSGIGLGLGNLFGSLLGGFCNFFGGMSFGLPGFGIGGFGGMFGGFPGFSGLSGLWGGGQSKGNCNCNCHSNRSGRASSAKSNNNTRTSGNKRSKSSTSCTNRDGAKLHELRDKFQDIQNRDNPTEQELKNLYKEVKKLSENDLDPGHSSEDKNNYKDLLEDILNYAKSKNINLSDNGEVSSPEAETVNEAAKILAERDKLNEILSTKPDSEKNVNFINTIPDSVRSLYYENGYSNYDGTEDITNKDITRAHDNSGNTRDTNKASGKPNATITKSSNGNHPQTIVIHDRKDITYTFAGKAGNEYLYESDQDHQLYVLQKDSSGNYHLMQYAYMKGYGYKDWA